VTRGGPIVRLAIFALALAVLAALAALVGRASGVETDDAPTEAMAHGATAEETHETAPAGLSLAQDGYRLVPEREALVAGRTQQYVFRILGPGGGVLRDYDLEHERLLHLIVAARSPSTHFLHLHPRRRDDGAWTVAVKLPVNGSYRVFADFTTAGERRTLGVDLAGYDGPSLVADSIPQFDVSLTRRGERLEFTVRRGGNPVRLQDYLGARGHLVVLREGDLAYIHAHAEEDELAFEVPFPTSGRYRLYLQFQLDGRVHTVQRTEVVP
jgi:hypothetical protein